MGNQWSCYSVITIHTLNIFIYIYIYRNLNKWQIVTNRYMTSIKMVKLINI